MYQNPKNASLVKESLACGTQSHKNKPIMECHVESYFMKKSLQ